MGRQKEVNSLLVAIFALELQVCKIVSDLIQIDNISIILVTSVLLLLCINNKKISLNKLSIIIYFGICVFFTVSFLLYEYQYVSEHFFYYIFFGTSALVISSVKNVDYILILKYAVYISVIRSIFYVLFEMNNMRYLASLIDKSIDWSYDRLQMQLAFEFMQIAIIAIVVIAFRNRVSDSKLFLASTLICVIVSMKVILIDCWTRGALVGIGATIIIILIWKRSRSGLEIVCIALCAILFVINLEPLLLSVNSFLVSKGINIRALTKSISLFSNNNVTNNRVELYVEAVELFLSSPIFGTGIGYFEKRTGIAYVHNIFLQSLCEMGIIGFITVTRVIYKNIKIVLYKKNSEIDIFINTLFLMSFFTLLTSGTYWSTPIFWLYFFVMLQQHKNTYRRLIKRE